MKNYYMAFLIISVINFTPAVFLGTERAAAQEEVAHCVICQNTSEHCCKKMRLKELPCGHRYDKLCLDLWARRLLQNGSQPTCPMCREGFDRGTIYSKFDNMCFVWTKGLQVVLLTGIVATTGFIMNICELCLQDN